MNPNKNLTKEIIAAAESLDIQDLFEACAWIREDGVTLFDEKTDKEFNVIPQMAELSRNPDFECTRYDSLEKLLLGVMEVIKDHCRDDREKMGPGSTVEMFFDNYRLWKEMFDADEKAGKDHPDYGLLKLFALHDTLCDWLRFSMQVDNILESDSGIMVMQGGPGSGKSHPLSTHGIEDSDHGSRRSKLKLLKN